MMMPTIPTAVGSELFNQPIMQFKTLLDTSAHECWLEQLPDSDLERRGIKKSVEARRAIKAFALANFEDKPNNHTT